MAIANCKFDHASHPAEHWKKLHLLDCGITNEVYAALAVAKNPQHNEAELNGPRGLQNAGLANSDG
jgi:hypothetical protein